MRSSLVMGSSCKGCSGATASGAARARRGPVRVQAASTAVPSQYKNVTPVGGRVLVKVDTGVPTSAAGIIMPSAVSKKSTRGEVVSTSGETLEAGANILYSQYAGTEVSISDTEYVLLKEEDVVGLIAAGSSMETLSPLADRILVEVAEAEDTSAGGVLLTSATAEKPTLGKVLAVGPGRKEEENVVPVSVAVGSTILYSKYSGTELEDDDKQYIVIREADVLAELA